MLFGPPGAGKTSIAQSVAVSLAQRFPDGIAWVGVAGEPLERIIEELQAVARAVGLASLPEPGRVGARAWLRAWSLTFFWGDRALILDGLEEVEELEAIWADDAPGPVLLITDRRSVVDRVGAEAVEVGPLARESGVHLLTLLVGEARAAADPVGLEQLVELVEGRPRPIAVAGKVLATERLTRPSDYHAELQASVEDTGGMAPSFFGCPQLDRHLCPAVQHALHRWAPFGRAVFPLSWAVAAAERDEPTVRRILSQLEELYLAWVRVDCGGELTIKLDPIAAACGELGVGGRRSADAVRVIEHARRRALQLPPEEAAEERTRAWTREECAWVAVLDWLAAALPGEHASEFGRLLGALGPSLLGRRRADASRWVGAALAFLPGEDPERCMLVALGDALTTA
ncbi:MAG: hypothetical protein KDA24_28660 [Deltaproteobacteria bacterium]|nr:hypothetical protein [Deltaproteobacteria bacterium]